MVAEKLVRSFDGYFHYDSDLRQSPLPHLKNRDVKFFNVILVHRLVIRPTGKNGKVLPNLKKIMNLNIDFR